MNQHLLIAPILIPFVAGAVMLLSDDRRRVARFWLSLASVLALLGIAVRLLVQAKGDVPGSEAVYRLGDWAAPMAITLVLDHLSAMMLLLTAVLALASLIYAKASWDRQGQHFFPLFQFLLMGLNGAFLTGDLFNLFVFFEVMLAASYGLLLHGSGRGRVRSGLHYIAINLAASLLFLLGVSLIYGVTGTLNMAHLASIIADVAPTDRPLLHLGLSLLGVAFLIKAGCWPLSFWLPPAYTAAAAPVGAIFAIMTKVGVYVILRLSMLFFGATAGASAGFGGTVLIGLGLATTAFAILGVLGSQGMGRIAAHSMILSSGTVLAVVGFAVTGGHGWMLAGALYYLVASTLATAILFMLVEPASRDDGGSAAILALTAEIYGADAVRNLDETPDRLVIPAGLAVLGCCFGLGVLALAGLPPLPGFVGKMVMIQGALADASLSPALTWSFIGLLLASGLATLIALSRIGIQTFWASEGDAPPVMALEIAPVILLIAMLGALSLHSEAVLRYTDRTAERLLDAPRYGPRPLPAATEVTP